ncbi:nad(p)h-dependent fmn-containing oxidoreductase ywqn-related [Anaeramoeba flamelloides]|uniref:Nad(P)h-dependent fmn-containing oxidoreductase ywqn-related n=1 Tax=Anaeramoeba flamelloides TaxID=1746091 RepID=A0AAV7YZ89_9EUKA|nr:nad(p)h-dependent fmn-containing oxidoreductase ywqn-related [Anaeramoeba flamelloides]KAJ6242207.1 nad(p)h-dependent fmn-containing oxidoreductase ywqn-related [Anaeramoeba flamelloides]
MNKLLKPLKIVAFNGSPRRKGNTFLLIQQMFKVFQKHNVETELVNITKKDIDGCTDCGICEKRLNYKCAIESDCVNDCIEKLRKADGFILGTPVYFAGPSGQMKCFIDRICHVDQALRRNNKESFLRHKVTAGISAHASAGATNTLSQLNYLFTISNAIIPGSTYWNFGVGHEIGDVLKDKSGLENMDDLANEMVHLMKMVRLDNRKKKEEIKSRYY